MSRIRAVTGRKNKVVNSVTGRCGVERKGTGVSKRVQMVRLSPRVLR